MKTEYLIAIRHAEMPKNCYQPVKRKVGPMNPSPLFDLYLFLISRHDYTYVLLDFNRFNEILISRSNSHLRAVFEEYEKMSNKTVEEALKSEMSGDLLRAFLSVGEHSLPSV